MNRNPSRARRRWISRLTATGRLSATGRLTATGRLAATGRRSATAGRFAATAGLLACCAALAAQAASAVHQPLVLEATVVMPDVPQGPYSDYLVLDLPGNRLFATPQAAKGVAVIDLKSNRVLRMISGIGNTHGLFYSPNTKRLFVADGESGEVKVFDGGDYSLIKTIPVARGADWMIYDPSSQFIYVNNGGDEAGMDHSLITAVDTVRMEKVVDIPMATPALEASVIDSARQLLYVNLVDESAVAIVDLRKRQTVGKWQLPGSEHRNMAIALDSSRSRLYVATRDSPMHGSIIVLDAISGHAVATLPIGGWADGIFIDAKRHRIYASTGVGHIETYAIEAHDVYHRQPTVDTAVMAKTSLYSSEIDRMYVSAPHLGHDLAQVFVFKPYP